jgi:galactokinase
MTGSTGRGGVDAGVIDPERLRAALRAVEPLAAASPDAIEVARAPGRVNLIGEYTDFNEGFVLPVAIGLEIRIALVPTDDRRVEVVLDETGERAGFSLDAIGERRGGWIDYVAGTAWSLSQAGIPLRGFRGVLASDLPVGSGLSSSAALELASARALLVDQADGIDRPRLALLAQRAENAYVGVQCGIMDQFASSVGNRDGAVLLDCRSLDHRAVHLPTDAVALVVCDTGAPRKLESSAYNDRRAACERIVALLADRGAPVRALRDVDEEMLGSLVGSADPVDLRRAEHVVRENARVIEAVDALEAADLAAAGRLFAESHASLRELFEVSSPELDALVETALAVPGVVAARMTGAGFGGCTVNLVRHAAVDDLRRAVDTSYRERTGRVPRVFVVEPAPGASLLA